MSEKLVLRSFVSHVYLDLKENDHHLIQLLAEAYEHWGEDPGIEAVANLLEVYRHNIISRDSVLHELYHMQFDD